MRADRLLIAVLIVLAGAPQAHSEGLNLPEIESFELENGIEVQLVRHPVVPIVAVEVWIGAGAIEDPAGQEGLAALTADAIRKGAGERDATEFAAAIDFLGARFATSVDAERTRVRIDLQSRDLANGLNLLADAILRPSFPEEQILKLRDQMAEEVVSDKENPRNVLAAYHRAHVFAGHPYGRPVGGTETSLPALSPQAVRDFHANHYRGGRTQITVAGDIDPSEVRQLVASHFETMPAAPDEPSALSTPVVPQAASVLLVNKSDTPQTWFRIGTTGPSWSDLDDYAATEIVRTVFGGRFTSWLNSALRIEAGLTYGAGFRMWRAGTGGEAAISTFTATETTRDAVDLALAQLDRLHEEGLSEQDLVSAKTYLRGQLPYEFETATAIAGRLAELKFRGVDRGHIDTLFDQIDAVTLDDCDAAIARWFRRDSLQITAIGVAGEVESILAGYGPVRIRENSDPGFDPPAGSDESR
jgi:predicted Zn-dependent peptidase